MVTLMTDSERPPPTGSMEPVQLADVIVAIASSAGGLRALALVLGALPATINATIVVVQHLDPNYRSQLAQILDKKTLLAVFQAREGDILKPGRVYVAPPGFHLLVTPERKLSLSTSHRVHFVRPSADLLFESAALVFKERMIAVVLTGTGVDGAGGVVAVKQQGGIVIAQDEATAEFFGMPGAAIGTEHVDYVLPLTGIAGKLVELVDSIGGPGDRF
jgi:two-component system, chemotaxis family, protein-glutamate methylesterase/glutaminase